MIVDFGETLLNKYESPCKNLTNGRKKYNDYNFECSFVNLNVTIKKHNNEKSRIKKRNRCHNFMRATIIHVEIWEAILEVGWWRTVELLDSKVR